MDTGLACLEGVGRLGGRGAGSRSSTAVLDDHACAEASQRGQSPHPLLLDRRCASASERQTERRQPAQFPHSGIGHAHARSGRSVLDAGARADCPGRPHGKDQAHSAVQSRQAFRNITREGTGTSTDLHLADGLVQVGGVLAGWVHEPRKWPSMRSKRSSRPRLPAASLWIRRSMAPRTDIQSARDGVACRMIDLKSIDKMENY